MRECGNCIHYYWSDRKGHCCDVMECTTGKHWVPIGCLGVMDERPE